MAGLSGPFGTVELVPHGQTLPASAAIPADNAETSCLTVRQTLPSPARSTHIQLNPQWPVVGQMMFEVPVELGDRLALRKGRLQAVP